MEDYGREHRAIVAQCIADEGFDYEVDGPDDGAPEVEQIEPDEQNTETWVATHGYGVFTRDPATVAADEAWADCMAEAGFGGFDSPTAASESFSDEYVDGYLSNTPDEDELTGLREREIDTALADLRCKQDTGYDEVVLTALHAAEEQFIVDHRAQLDALIAEYGN